MARSQHAPQPAAEARAGAQTSTRRRATDRVARWIVSGGGFAIIASILGILVFILVEVAPLVGRARAEPVLDARLPNWPGGAVVVDEHRSHAVALARDGVVRALRLADRSVVLERAATPPLSRVDSRPEQSLLTGTTVSGTVIALPISWEVAFEGDTRVVTPISGESAAFELFPAGTAPVAFTVTLGEDGSGTAAAVTSDGRLAVAHRSVEVNLFTGESTAEQRRVAGRAPWPVSSLVLDEDGSNLYAGGAGGELAWWSLGNGELRPPRVVPSAGRPAVSALALLIGDRSLVVGRDDGSLSIWFPLRETEGGEGGLRRVRGFPSHAAAIVRLAPSMRGKGFLALDERGGLGLYHSTSERVLWTGASPLPEATALAFAPKADAAFLSGRGRVASLEIHNPHPEVSLRSLFGRVWYEDHPQPEYVWQSSGGSDDFEPKLSLTPLLVGTLKGTLYSLLLAIPLGVLGAMYTSQFMHPTLRYYVKPTVEIMAALPSVVLGFLAGLWLAPRIEQLVPALSLMLVLLPGLVIAAGLAWRSVPRAIRGRFRAGSETLLYLAVLVAGIWLALRLGAAWERVAFDGDFPAWLLEATGLRYDQRNAVVAGLAMGFAVIPIIFSIAEDAFSNVPRNLIAGSLALGANRWQTVARVVLPTASPGVFSAIIIGFGRAVGETMIVLMATGNTPILDWNPFTGLRTLSANIAVEIPEAPQGGTLYRTLFLAALLLFLITFAVNTLAEVIRQRLRRRYAQM